MPPVILTFVRHYLPGYKSGGPVRTISNMVETLGDEFEFRIICLNRDFGDDTPYDGIKTEQWCRIGKAWVYYMSPDGIGFSRYRKIFQTTPHDAVYLNSLFDPAFTLLPLTVWRSLGSEKQPIVLAPRGELSPGALAIKRWKKQPFLWLAQNLGVYKNATWHASTEDEAQLICNHFGQDANCIIACDLPSPITQPKAPANSVGKNLRVLFLSRICKKKNLLYALQVVAQAPIPVSFDIWGTIEDKAYWSKCCRFIETSMPSNVSVTYRGPAEHTEVSKIMVEYDLFFLPTLGENYGHVIAESLSVGTPVLISDQTPWHDLAAQGVGWALPLENDNSAFLQAIIAADNKTPDERSKWRERVYEYAILRLHDPSLIEDNRRIFLHAIKNSNNDNRT